MIYTAIIESEHPWSLVWMFDETGRHAGTDMGQEDALDRLARRAYEHEHMSDRSRNRLGWDLITTEAV